MYSAPTLKFRINRKVRRTHNLGPFYRLVALSLMGGESYLLFLYVWLCVAAAAVLQGVGIGK